MSTIGKGLRRRGEADAGGGEPAAPEPERRPRASDRGRADEPQYTALRASRAWWSRRCSCCPRCAPARPCSGAAEQPQPRPRPARDASAHAARRVHPRLHRGGHEGARTEPGGAGARPVGPGAAPRTRPQRQGRHRRQDARQHPHLAPAAPMLARRPLHRPAAPPGRGHHVPDQAPRGSRPRGHPRRSPRLRRAAGGGQAEPGRPRGQVRGPHRRPGADHPRPVRLPRCPVGERDARLRQQGPRRLPPAAGRLVQHHQVGPHPARARLPTRGSNCRPGWASWPGNGATRPSEPNPNPYPNPRPRPQPRPSGRRASHRSSPVPPKPRSRGRG